LINLDKNRLSQILDNVKGKRIAVIGDLMVDQYIWGTVNRISPEAPVAVVDVEREQERLGGAANVARNIQSLGGEPFLIGVVGDDNTGKALVRLVSECGFDTSGIVTDPSRPTTIKTRIIAHNQHVVRIDRETRGEIAPEIEKKILGIMDANIAKLDAIIIEDYNKGVVIKSLIREIIARAEKHNRIVTVDPKFNNFFDYKNVTVFKPNRKEVEEALGLHIRTDEDVDRAAKEIMSRLHAKNVLLTRGENGMTLFDSDGGVFHAPTKAQNVADVSGAGDTVIATLTLAMTGGASVREAATMANYAGGIVCGYVGIVPINRQELASSILTDGAAPKGSQK